MRALRCLASYRRSCDSQREARSRHYEKDVAPLELQQSLALAASPIKWPIDLQPWPMTSQPQSYSAD